MFSLFIINCQQNVYVPVEVEGKLMQMELDTGSWVTIVNSKCSHQNWVVQI